HSYALFFRLTCLSLVFSLLICSPPRSSLFTYATLFRSIRLVRSRRRARELRRVRAALPQPAVPLDRLGDAAQGATRRRRARAVRSEEHTSELQSRVDLVCRLLLEKKKEKK